MPDIAEILDATHAVWTASRDHWKREETRLFGGYPMLGELERFTNETDASYTSRKQQSPLLNFGRIHAGIVIGHLSEVAPTPNYGTLGDVRERKAIPRGQETPAELFHYNANGVGSNGLQFTALASGIQVRALATGFRWTMVEMPRRRTGNPDAPITQEDVRNGHRPFIVEYSPRAVPMWESTDGRLDWAVVRVPHRPAGEWTSDTPGKGYYLLVREGYAALGDEFAGGGWWLYDPDKQPIDNGTWNRTNGEIPLTMFVAEESEGTEDHPAVATMPLMELNQLASGLMNRISERNWNARNAAKSQKYILGAEMAAFNLMAEHVLAGNYLIPVPGSATPDGKWLIPNLYDGANGAVESSVYATIIQSTIAEAHEIMVRQVTSTPDSTGRSKEAGFNEATSPLLSALAIRRETWENTVIPWVEMRAGAEQPSGFVQWPTEFDITPIVAKIDRAVERMTKIGARSATLEARMIEMAATDEGAWPSDEGEAQVVRDELVKSLTVAGRDAQAKVFDTLSRSGTAAGAAAFAMIDGEDAAALTTLGDEGTVDAPVVPMQGGEPMESGAEENGTAPAPAMSRGDDQMTQARGTAGAAPSSASTPNAPAVDLSPVVDRIDALAEQIKALVAVMAAQKPAEPMAAPPPPPPAPLVIFPPSAPAVGKAVSVTAPDGRRWSVNVEPTESPNGTTPVPNA
jgi:hypothetical protein